MYNGKRYTSRRFINSNVFGSLKGDFYWNYTVAIYIYLVKYNFTGLDIHILLEFFFNHLPFVLIQKHPVRLFIQWYKMSERLLNSSS